jgi:hypothetical protein
MKTKIITTLLSLLMCSAVAFAQDKTKSMDMKSSPAKMEMAKDSVYYTCSMHPEVIRDMPGKCPKCGMALVKKTIKMTDAKSKNKDAKLTYTCSMHPEVISDKPGKCPKCGMVLIVKK